MAAVAPYPGASSPRSCLHVPHTSRSSVGYGARQQGISRHAASFPSPLTAKDQNTLVKICGVTNAVDAEAAAKAGANFIGMIMWSKAKRSISTETARTIVDIAHEYGAKAVGVYVDEDADTILSTSRAAGLDIVQLHGQQCRESLLSLDADVPVVYVMNATTEGQVVTPTPSQLASQLSTEPLKRGVEWVLVDGMQGGGGVAFDWLALQAPTSLASQGWLLAGGLHPGNVAEAVRILRPSGVDVSSGVCGPDGLLKDHGKIRDFIAAARSA